MKPLIAARHSDVARLTRFTPAASSSATLKDLPLIPTMKLKGFFSEPQTFFTAAWVALALQSSGYLAETFRAGIEAVPRGQREAGLSAGMSHALAFRRIVLPQVLLMVAPSLVNQFTVIVNSSTLVSVITVQDLMFQSQKVVHTWLDPIEILTATAAIYILVVFAVSALGKALADVLRRRYGLAAS